MLLDHVLMSMAQYNVLLFSNSWRFRVIHLVPTKSESFWCSSKLHEPIFSSMVPQESCGQGGWDRMITICSFPISSNFGITDQINRIQIGWVTVAWPRMSIIFVMTLVKLHVSIGC